MAGGHCTLLFVHAWQELLGARVNPICDRTGADDVDDDEQACPVC